MLEITLPRIKNTKTQGNYASYDIEPLEAGYGMTLGRLPGGKELWQTSCENSLLNNRAALSEK